MPGDTSHVGLSPKRGADSDGFVSGMSLQEILVLVCLMEHVRSLMPCGVLLPPPKNIGLLLVSLKNNLAQRGRVPSTNHTMFYSGFPRDRPSSLDGV